MTSDSHAALVRLVCEDQPALETVGVIHLHLFGSQVRGDHRSDSNLDVLVEFDNDSHGYFNIAKVKGFLESLLHITMDVQFAEAVPDGHDLGKRRSVFSSFSGLRP
jgi:predicted nucleotidyltransferase